MQKNVLNTWNDSREMWVKTQMTRLVKFLCNAPELFVLWLPTLEKLSCCFLFVFSIKFLWSQLISCWRVLIMTFPSMRWYARLCLFELVLWGREEHYVEIFCAARNGMNEHHWWFPACCTMTFFSHSQHGKAVLWGRRATMANGFLHDQINLLWDFWAVIGPGAHWPPKNRPMKMFFAFTDFLLIPASNTLLKQYIICPHLW